MIFSSIPFLFFFFPVFLLLYYLVPFKYKNLILLIFSLIFYAWGEPIYITLMIFSSVVDYINGLMIEKHNDDEKIKKRFLIFSIIVNLSLLGFFKYSDFLINSFNNIFNTTIPLLKLGLPIGISFFTFQTMSYSIDVYRGEVKAEKNVVTWMTYVAMFPQLIAGPIGRYETVSRELHEREINFKHFCNGLLRFMRGLFKKVIIANNVGYLWAVMSTSSDLSVLGSWLGILAFFFQIYFDFSGYSDMAIGMGKMLGFNYLENFNYPYTAKSITDFWRRWHISLSTWFRDYVYIPLGGSRVKRIINIRNIFIVWMLTGLWHGASWNFVLWGVYYGVLLILEKFILKKYIDKLPNVLKHLYTIILVIIGWLIFAFEDMSMLSNYAKIMFGLNGEFINSTFLYYFSNYFIILLIATIFSMPVYEKIERILKNKKYVEIKFTLTLIIYVALLIITTAYLVSDTYNPFLYFRF